MSLFKPRYSIQALFFILIILFLSNKLFANENKTLLWKTSAGNYFSERFFQGEQINIENINNLTKLWTFNSGSTAKLQTVQSPPIFIGDQLILVSLNGDLISLSPNNGKILWKKKLETPLGRRGLTYYQSDNKDIEGIYVASGKSIVQLNKNGEIQKIFFTGLSLVQPYVDENSQF